MGIIKNTLDKQIKSNNLKQYSDTTGLILDYDKLTNSASIRYPNPYGEGYLYRSNVKISNSLGGVTGNGIKPGIECNIAFLGNNMYAPIITGVLTNNYTIKTNTDQGAFIPDMEIANVGTIIGKPMMSDWLSNSDNPYKYITEFGDFTVTDVSESVYNVLNELDKYSDGEEGITNLDTKSTIKLRDNGDIDIFVSNSVGMRISRSTHKIYLYGLGLYFNDQEICYNFYED
jgi:hypothetical protein